MSVYLVRVDTERRTATVTRESGPAERFEPFGSRTRLAGFEELRQLLQVALLRIAAGNVPQAPSAARGAEK